MISRRALLIGGAAIGMVSAFAVRTGLAKPETAIALVLRRQLTYLMIDDDDIANFARDLAESGRTSLGKMRLIAALAPLYRLLPSGGGGPEAVRYGEERIITEFLLSSDFFIHGADIGKPVRYLGLHDPWKLGNACRNPFHAAGSRAA